MTITNWVLDGVAMIASGIAWYYAVQARRSARRVRQIRSGGVR